MATITIQTVAGPRETEARWIGQFLAVHLTKTWDANGPKRGAYTITYHRAGMAAAHLLCSLKAAVKLAKAWDLRFSSLDPKDAKRWGEREAWGYAVREAQAPQIAARLARKQTKRWLDQEFGAGQDTAAVLAAEAKRPIDQAGGSKLTRWRGQWYALPTDQQLQDWSIDSVCETPDGRTVEPDHPDSWLRILHLV